MKNTAKFLTALLIISLSVFSTGCEKDNDSITPTPPISTPVPVEKKVSAKVNNVSWSATSISAWKMYGMINITANAPDGSLIGITLDESNGIGTFTAGDYDDTKLRYAKQVNYLFLSGSVEVTKLSSSAVVGTFEFSCKEYDLFSNVEINITNGVFSFPLK